LDSDTITAAALADLFGVTIRAPISWGIAVGRR